MPIIKQGESFGYEFDRDGDSIDGWTCVLNLKKHPDDTTLIKRTITPTNDVWSGFLTRADTKNLDVSPYLLIATLTKGTEKEVKTDRFYVSKAW